MRRFSNERLFVERIDAQRAEYNAFRKKYPGTNTRVPPLPNAAEELLYNLLKTEDPAQLVLFLNGLANNLILRKVASF